MTQKIIFDYNNMMADKLGAHGITASDIDKIAPQIKSAFDTVMSEKGKGMMGWSDMPYNQGEIVQEILETAEYVRANFEYFVVLGIGGSALGPIAVFQALCHLHHNDLPKAKRGGAPKFYVEDNVDPERMQALLDVIDPEKTCFNVITKSGATSETMSQYLIISDILEKAYGTDAARHIIATTDSKKGNLIKIAREKGYRTFYIPDGVGGRFSEICPVGLLPAAVLGIDIREMLAGCAYMDEICRDADPRRNMALMAATLQYIAMQKGCNVTVCMPYADSLKYISDWFCQLWGESLGKRYDKEGKEVFVGQTPVKSLGVTDQHSQVQLYAEGPFDKVITFIAVDKYRTDVTIAEGCADIPDVHFLCGHTMSELINTERRATAYALTKAGKLNHTIILPEVNAHTLGQLLYFFMLETAFAGALLNINTFNQPGVEEGKNATYAMFGRVGYETKKAELDSAPQDSADYVL